uniref:CRIB domain-containing protein n=1 Tax=Sinocyclocheilus rhinocerous TaxID=307959 RepID=A0A673IF61_9TELE
MTEFWVCFSCCIAEQPQPKRRRRIDRTMIGEPTNFVHMTHVGSGDMVKILADKRAKPRIVATFRNVKLQLISIWGESN